MPRVSYNPRLIMKKRGMTLIVVMWISCFAFAQTTDETPAAVALRVRKADSEQRALFQNTDTLQLTLEASFGTINSDRNPESTKTYPGVLKMTDASKGSLDIPVQIAVRGNFRRKDCEFVPLRILFSKDA